MRLKVSESEMKKIKQQGYSQGYAAGKKRLAKENRAEELRKLKNEFFNQALLTALPNCITAQGWKSGGLPLTNVAQRTSLANDFAQELLKYWRAT